MKQLIEDYKRRLETISEMIKTEKKSDWFINLKAYEKLQKLQKVQNKKHKIMK